MSDDLRGLLNQAAQGQAFAPDGNDTTARIVAAALALFAERSYEAATTAAIATRAGVTEKTLFRHFGSKETLFNRTVYPALLRLLEPLVIAGLREKLANNQADFRTLVHTIVADRIRFVVAHPAIFKLVAQELLLRPGFRAVFFGFVAEQVLPTLERALEAVRARGELRDLPAMHVLRTIASQIFSYAFARTVLFPDSAWDDEVAIAQITSTILDGLATPASEVLLPLPGVDPWFIS